MELNKETFIYIVCKYNNLVYSANTLPLFCHLKPDKVVIFKIPCSSTKLLEYDPELESWCRNINNEVLVKQSLVAKAIETKVLGIMSKLFTNLVRYGNIIHTDDIIANQEYKKCLENK